MNPIQRIVHASLLAGKTSANEIRHATGLAHEVVYEALIGLECIGTAVLTCSMGANSRVTKEWAAL